MWLELLHSYTCKNYIGPLTDRPLTTLLIFLPLNHFYLYRTNITCMQKFSIIIRHKAVKSYYLIGQKTLPVQDHYKNWLFKMQFF